MDNVKNWQFCDGSHFQDNIQQLGVPNDWYLRYTDHQPIPVADPPIEGLRPESVCASIWDVGGEWGKFGDSPPNPHNYNTVLKIHKGFAPFSFELAQRLDNLVIGKTYMAKGWMFPDFYDANGTYPSDQDYAAACGILVEGQEIDWQWANGKYGTWMEIESQFVATSTTMEIGLAGFCKWGYPGNTWWLHGMRVEEDGGTPTPPTADGDPREQYERTYVLLHQNEGSEMWHAVVDASFALGQRLTIGPSADDAGIGRLNYRRAIVVNPSAWESEGDIAEFFEQYYPGVKYVPVYAADAGTLYDELRRIFQAPETTTVTAYSQNDPRWKDTIFSGDATFGQYGCFVTSISSWMNEEPPVVAAKLREAGCFNGAMLSYPANISIAYPSVTWAGFAHWREGNVDVAMLRQEIEREDAAICEVRWDPSKPPVPNNQHFVVVEALNGNDATIMDPWDGKHKQLSASRYAIGHPGLSALTGIRKFRSGITPPPPPINNTGKLLSPHLQTAEQPDLDWIARNKPNVVKFLNSAGDGNLARAIKAVSPNTKVVYRHWFTDTDIARMVEDPNLMDWGFDNIPQDIYDAVADGSIDFVETHCNEANQWYPTAKWAAADMKFVEVLARRMPRAKPITMCISVGHPWNEAEYEQLVPLARATAARGGAGGYHAYFGVVDGQRLENWRDWHELRFVRIANVFAAHGVYLPWILGEGGACGMDTQGHFDSRAGWRSSYNGNFEAYKTHLDEFEEQLRRCAASVIGCTIFTVDKNADWPDFHIGPEQLELL